MEMSGKRRRGRQVRRWMDNITEDMKEFELNEKDIRDRVKKNPLWRLYMSRKSQKKKKKKKKERHAVLQCLHIQYHMCLTFM